MTKVITRPNADPVSTSTNKLAQASESWLDYLPLVQDRADALLAAVSKSYIDTDNETLYRLPRIALKTLQSIRAELAREKVDEAIYDASALIVAAMATAEAHSPAFTSLHQALDLVHGLMYAHEPNSRLLNFDEVKKALAVTQVSAPAAEQHSVQPPAQKVSTGDAGEVTDFERGIAVAIDLLRAEEASRGQDVTCYRRHREGRTQFRFWREHLEKLVADPALIEGFDAVMSAAREDGQCVGVSELERVAPNEYLAGEIGADGTVPDDAINAAWKAVEPATVRIATCDIELATANATSVLRVACHDANSDSIWGIFKLAELANEAADAALRHAGTLDIDLLQEASDRYAQAIELCGLASSKVHSEMIFPGLMLMQVSKERIDALAESMQQEAGA